MKFEIYTKPGIAAQGIDYASNAAIDCCWSHGDADASLGRLAECRRLSMGLRATAGVMPSALGPRLLRLCLDAVPRPVGVV